MRSHTHTLTQWEGHKASSSSSRHPQLTSEDVPLLALQVHFADDRVPRPQRQLIQNEASYIAGAI